MKNISKMDEDELENYINDLADGKIEKHKSPKKGSEQKWKALIIWTKTNLKVPDEAIWNDSCALCVRCADIDDAEDNSDYNDCDYCPLNSYFKCTCDNTDLWYELKWNNTFGRWIELAEQFLHHIKEANKKFGKPRKELAK